MDRQIVCLHIPSFEIALARLGNTALRGRPVAVAASGTPRACLHEVSSEARQDGLEVGMSVEAARRLCPSLCLIPSEPLRVFHAQAQIHRIVARYAPVWEPARPGQVFLDLTGTGRLFGSAMDTARRIERDMIHSHNLAGVLGIAGNKLVSGVAAAILDPPPQRYDVEPGRERTFLAPLPISLLPGLRYIRRKTLALLHDFNLYTLGQIADMSLSSLQSVLGAPAKLLHCWAQGLDGSPVLPPVQRPCVEVSLELEPDDIDSTLSGRLYELLEQLCRQLRRQRQLCHRLTLLLQYSDHVHASTSFRFPSSTHWEADMYPCLKELFVRCFTRRVRLRTVTISADVVDAESAPGEQLSLFDEHSAPHTQPNRDHRLAAVLDGMRERFGDRSMRWGQVDPSKKRPARSSDPSGVPSDSRQRNGALSVSRRNGSRSMLMSPVNCPSSKP